jgi:hypothetical protein
MSNSAAGGKGEVVAQQPSCGGEESQHQLIKLIDEYATRYNNAPNDMAQGGAA